MNPSSIVLLFLAFVVLAAALSYIFRGIRLRSVQSAAKYGVDRQENRKQMLSSFLYGILLVAVGLGLWIAFGWSVRSPQIQAASTETPQLPVLAATATMLPAALPVTEQPLPTPNLLSDNVVTTAKPTAPPDIPTLTPTPLPTLTPTPEPPRAVINSPNGLYLRDAPGGEIVELAADGAELELLPNQQSVDGETWQQVRSNAGNVGWVAVQFISLIEQ